MIKRITYGVDEKGNALGEAHHRAKLCDADVELIRSLHEAGLASYRVLADVFNVSKETVRDIVTFRRRATSPMEYRTVKEGSRKAPPASQIHNLTKLGVSIEMLDAWQEEWDGSVLTLKDL